MKATTERFDPTEAGSPDELAIAVLHLYAYERAAELVGSGDRVLDVGFGEGYGSRILIERGADYIGLELEAEVVDHARARYEGSFSTYDGLSIPARDATFNLVVSFQVIEHLADPTPWLEEIRRVLVPDGTALITTPNRLYRLFEGQRPWNRYHAREYSAGELEALLRRTFSQVVVYGISAAEPIDSIVRARADRARRLARLDPLRLRYWLPESLNAPLRRALRRAAPPAVEKSGFTLDRVWHDEASAGSGLDLLAQVRP